MAQTELMLRLIFSNKIVGYMQIYHGEIYYQYNNTNAYINPLKHRVPLSSIPPRYDHIEHGINEEDDWFFSGDIIEITDVLHPFVAYLPVAIDDTLRVKIDDDVIHIFDLKDNGFEFKKIGSVHDGELIGSFVDNVGDDIYIR